LGGSSSGLPVYKDGDYLQGTTKKWTSIVLINVHIDIHPI